MQMEDIIKIKQKKNYQDSQIKHLQNKENPAKSQIKITLISAKT